MLWLIVLFFAAHIEAETRAADNRAPLRIVSFDVCADQLVLELVPRANIAALSPDADGAFSYYKARAAGIPQTGKDAERILGLQPTHIMRSYGGLISDAFYRRLGIQTVSLGWSTDLYAIGDELIRIGRALGESEAATTKAKAYRASLARLQRPHSGKQALYITPGGVTAGQDTLIDALFRHVGLTNFESRIGWHTLPLERLVVEQPDIIVTGFLDTHVDTMSQWSAMRHPVADRLTKNTGEVKLIHLSGAVLACQTPALIDALEKLRLY